MTLVVLLVWLFSSTPPLTSDPVTPWTIWIAIAVAVDLCYAAYHK